MTDNDLLLDYSGASQLAAIQALINRAAPAARGRASASPAPAPQSNPQHNTTLGAMEATSYDAIYGAGATFNGVDPDPTAVLVKYTYYGDADFNGDREVRRLQPHRRRLQLNNRTGWINGDYDGNGIVNFDDYSLIDLAFSTQGAVL